METRTDLQCRAEVYRLQVAWQRTILQYGYEPLPAEAMRQRIEGLTGRKMPLPVCQPDLPQ